MLTDYLNIFLGKILPTENLFRKNNKTNFGRSLKNLSA